MVLKAQKMLAAQKQSERVSLDEQNFEQTVLSDAVNPNHASNPISGELLELPQGVRDELASSAMAKKVDEAIAKFCIAENQYGRMVMFAKCGLRTEVLDIESQAGEDALCIHFGMPSKTSLDRLRIQIRYKVRSEARRIHTYRRVGRDSEGAYLVDLGNEAGDVVRIIDGVWEVIPDQTAAFMRERGYASLPYPDASRRTRKAYSRLHNWLKLLGVPNSRIPLVVASLVCYLKEGSTYPILLLYGAAGCGKSTLLVLILKLIDPPSSNSAPHVRPTMDDIAAASQAKHVISMDNISKLPSESQDILCICATGGDCIQGMLYTNGDFVTLNIHRGVIVTAVTLVFTKPDLLSRAVPAELTSRSERKQPAEIFAEFENEASDLFGALLDLVAASTLPFEAELPIKHRLYDLCLAGQRIFHAAGLDPAVFMHLVDRMRANSGAEIMEGDQFASSVRKVLSDQESTSSEGEKLPGYKSWWKEGVVAIRRSDRTIFVGFRPKVLLKKIGAGYLDWERRGWMPDNTHALNSALLRATPVFADVGIKVEKKQASEGRPYWQFTWTVSDDD